MNQRTKIELCRK